MDDDDAIVFELVLAERFNVYIVRAFENIDKEDEKEGSDALVEDENMHTSKAIKKNWNCESKGNYKEYYKSKGI